jgi:hypothetical protein
LVLGGLAAAWHPSSAWVERYFSNGYYPFWERFWASITVPASFSVNDVVIAVAVAIAVVSLLWVRPFWRALLGIAGLAALFALWFYAGWGYGYDRAPVETRTAFSADRVNTAAIDALRSHAIAQMNALAAPAHRIHESGARVGVAQLNAAWLPVVQRLGDRWTPRVGPAKVTVAGWFMDATGTSGFTSPFTLETYLAPDLLWFERPFVQSHEWSHAAGYNREDEANYIAAITCLRDPDPVVRYSGWFEIFTYLPPQHARYVRSEFVPDVWADFAAVRARNSRFVNLKLSTFSWHVYNSYLKSNHVVSGVQNYNQVTRLLAGIPLDGDGLPLARETDR